MDSNRLRGQHDVESFFDLLVRSPVNFQIGGFILLIVLIQILHRSSPFLHGPARHFWEHVPRVPGVIYLPGEVVHVPRDRLDTPGKLTRDPESF